MSGPDHLTDAAASGPILNTKPSAHSCGSSCICLARQPAMCQIRTITDESPDSHFKFMKMPYDIRREVYLLLMGHCQIYITSENSGSIAEETEIEGFIKLLPTYSFPTGPRGVRSSKDTRVSLSILRVSHQIYDEARILPYTHNTFHCMDVYTLEYFVYRRVSYQKQSLRCLSFKIDFHELVNPDSHQYFEFVMLEASCSLAGLRNLSVLTHLSRMEDDYDLTFWEEGLKIWATRRLGLSARVVVDWQVPDDTLISERRGTKLLQMMQVASALSEELWNLNMVEQHRELATEIFNHLPFYYRRILMESFRNLEVEKNSEWLPRVYPGRML
jgi:hypothetical protein